MLLLFFFPLQADRDGFDPRVLRKGLLVLRHRFLQLADLLLKAFLGVKRAKGRKRGDKKKRKQTLPRHFNSFEISLRKAEFESDTGRTLIRPVVASVKTISEERRLATASMSRD